MKYRDQFTTEYEAACIEAEETRDEFERGFNAVLNVVAGLIIAACALAVIGSCVVWMFAR